jgi:hypothetical protein
VGFVASDKERDFGERDTDSRWAKGVSECVCAWDWDSCWLSLLSNAWAEELRPGTEGRTCAILQELMTGQWPHKRHCWWKSSPGTVSQGEVVKLKRGERLKAGAWAWLVAAVQLAH